MRWLRAAAALIRASVLCRKEEKNFGRFGPQKKKTGWLVGAPFPVTSASKRLFKRRTAKLPARLWQETLVGDAHTTSAAGADNAKCGLNTGLHSKAEQRKQAYLDPS
jgi:hypothetical protein